MVTETRPPLFVPLRAVDDSTGRIVERASSPASIAARPRA
jgi:hypothetical protein